MGRKINPEEMKTPQLLEYAVVALTQLGGSSQKGPIIDCVGQILKDILKPADLELMCQRPSDGKQGYAQPGYTGKTWSVWSGKTSTSLMHAKGHGWLTSSKGVFTLNTRRYEAYSNACRKLVKSKIKSSSELLAFVRLL